MGYWKAWLHYTQHASLWWRCAQCFLISCPFRASVQTLHSYRSSGRHMTHISRRSWCSDRFKPNRTLMFDSFSSHWNVVTLDCNRNDPKLNTAAPSSIFIWVLILFSRVEDAAFHHQHDLCLTSSTSSYRCFFLFYFGVSVILRKKTAEISAH